MSPVKPYLVDDQADQELPKHCMQARDRVGPRTFRTQVPHERAQDKNHDEWRCDEVREKLFANGGPDKRVTGLLRKTPRALVPLQPFALVAQPKETVHHHVDRAQGQRKRQTKEQICRRNPWHQRRDYATAVCCGLRNVIAP